MTITIEFKDLPKGYKDPIFSYCRQLIAEGTDKQEELHVTRNGRMDFKVNVGNGASLRVDEDSTPRLAKYRPFSPEGSHADALFPAKATQVAHA